MVLIRQPIDFDYVWLFNSTNYSHRPGWFQQFGLKRPKPMLLFIRLWPVDGWMDRFRSCNFGHGNWKTRDWLKWNTLRSRRKGVIIAANWYGWVPWTVLGQAPAFFYNDYYLSTEPPGTAAFGQVKRNCIWLARVTLKMVQRLKKKTRIKNILVRSRWAARWSGLKLAAEEAATNDGISRKE